MRSICFAASCGVLAALSTAANASFVWASNVEAFSQGLKDNGQAVDLNRSNPLLALGAPQNNDTINFVSLGGGGSLVVSFGTLFHDQAVLIETTFGHITDHIEKANVFVGYGATAATATYWFAGAVVNTADGQPISLAGAAAASGRTTFKYLKIVDTTDFAHSTSTDGFDVDGVGVVPVPAPGAIALASAGGLLITRRRRNG